MSEASAIEILEAERSIQSVLTQYARGVDRCDESLLCDCYWPDSTDDHGGYKGSGHGFAAWVVNLLTKVFSSTQHAISNTRIECSLDDDLAHVESYVVARHPPEVLQMDVEVTRRVRDAAQPFVAGPQRLELRSFQLCREDPLEDASPTHRHAELVQTLGVEILADRRLVLTQGREERPVDRHERLASGRRTVELPASPRGGGGAGSSIGWGGGRATPTGYRFAAPIAPAPRLLAQGGRDGRPALD